MHQVQLFAYAISAYIDRNGLPHTPRIVVSHDLHTLITQATSLLTDLMDDITGDEHDEINVAGMLMTHYHDMEPMVTKDVFQDLDEDETYENAPKFYVAIGVDEDELEDLLIAEVGAVDDEDEDEYLEEDGELEEDNEEL